MKLKFSKYNVFFKHNETKYIGYNTLYNTIVLLDSELHNLLDNAVSTNKISGIQAIHPELYEILQKERFLIPTAIDELKDIETVLNKTNNESTTLSLIICPTIDCNCRCWYCYQNHNKKEMMSATDVDNIVLYIKTEIENNSSFLSIEIDWFGGEPLMGLSDVIKPLTKKVKAMLVDHKDVKYSSRMTTNAYLLDSDARRFLYENNNTNLQITIDGNRASHNSVRFTLDGKGDYDTIIENIKACVRLGMNVTARLNISEDTNLNVKELISDFADLSGEEKLHITFAIFRVWQSAPSVNIVVQNIAKEIASEGFSTHLQLNYPTTIRNTCYADKPKHVVVIPNGQIFKCSARNFTKPEGILLANGTIEWNDLYYKRMETTPLKRESCRKCSILPICAGSCSQKRLESPADVCVFNYNKEEKIEYAKKIFYNKVLVE